MQLKETPPSAGAGRGTAYYGAFAPGLEECIAAVLRERFPDLNIPLLLSGAAVFETSLSYDRFNLFCFNNIFRIIGMAANRGTGGESASHADLENFVRNTIRRRAGRDIASSFAANTAANISSSFAANSTADAAANTVTKGAFGGGAKAKGSADRTTGFRVIFSLENTPAAVSAGLRGEAEQYIASLSGLRVNRSKPAVEFWFLRRREGAFFMRRLSRHRPWDKLLHPGELPPPLAWTLCKLSGPRPGERVADPFCGYGSIPAARLRHFPPAEFFASDIDRHALQFAKDKFKGPAGKKQHHCVFNRCDVTELPRFIPPASLDSIITDPPWGFYKDSDYKDSFSKDNFSKDSFHKGLPAGDLYTQSLSIFSGLLKPGGRAVILCGRGDELKTAAGNTGFTIRQNIPILLSGRKTAILVLEYKPGSNP